jgi:hypothetical protein
MNHRTVVRLALAVALFAATVPATALAQVSFQAQAGDKWWNPSRDDQASRFNRVTFGGRWVAQDRNDANDHGFQGGYGSDGFRGGPGNGGSRGTMGGMMLPNVVQIDQGRRMVRIADRRNNLLQVIGIDNGFRAQREQAIYLKGTLRGTSLVAHGSVSRGQQITQTLTLRNRGQVLVVRTRVERGNSGRAFEFEKVYQRA